MTNNVSESAFIGEGVELGDGVSVGPGAVILGPCLIEDNVWIGPGAQIGAPPEMTSSPQNAAWSGSLDHAGVRIKRGAVIRELAVLHQGTYRPTTVGEDCWILNRAYIAHDVLINRATTVSAGVSIGGHCTIGPNVNIGMNASIHQRTVIAGGCMVGMGTPVTRDLPPFAKAYGSPLRIHGINRVGMKRLGINDECADAVEDSYRAGDALLDSISGTYGDPFDAVIAMWKSFSEKRPASFAMSLD
ncbi:MAG: acyl-ACP--UDP-N- acetylglucosamine O-acyltransferase [Microbacteriaceae bacterium]